MKISVFGMGIIGSRCADQLAASGSGVIRWNRTPKGLPCEVTDAAEAAAASHAISLYLKDAPAVREVIGRIASVLNGDQIMMNHSTIDLETTLWLADVCRDAGCRFVDAPFTGSKLAAADGKLQYYVGGDDDAVEAALPWLQPTAIGILRVGRAGDATVIKLATNLVAACHIEALAEAQGICLRHGLGADVIKDVFAKHGTASALSAMKIPPMLAGDFETHFSLDNMRKDSEYALSLADSLGLDLPAVRAVSQRMAALCGEGYAGADYCSLAAAYRAAPE